jgi:hypothetical protein
MTQEAQIVKRAIGRRVNELHAEGRMEAAFEMARLQYRVTKSINETVEL